MYVRGTEREREREHYIYGERDCIYGIYDLGLWSSTLSRFVPTCSYALACNVYLDIMLERFVPYVLMLSAVTYLSTYVSVFVHYHMFLFGGQFSSLCPNVLQFEIILSISLRLVILTLIQVSPNIVGKFSFTEEIVVKPAGVAAMNIESKKLMKKHNITSVKLHKHGRCYKWLGVPCHAFECQICTLCYKHVSMNYNLLLNL